MVPAVVAGLAIGSIYGLTATGLVLTYRTSNVFNFAHGAMGMFGAFVFYSLHRDHGWPLVPALAVIVVLVAPAIGIAGHYSVFRHVRARPIAVTLVATIVLLGIIQAAAARLFTQSSLLVSIFPVKFFRVTDGFSVSAQQLGTVVVSGGIALGLVWYLTRTRFGLTTRAVVDNPDLAEFVGTNSDRVQLLAWVVAAEIATFSAILVAGFIGLTVFGLTLVVIQATACAVLGRLHSLPLTYAGGLALGLLEAFLQRYLPRSQAAQGLKISAAFLVLYAAVVIGRRLFREAADVAGKKDIGGVLGQEVNPARVAPLVVLFAVLALVLPFLSPFTLFLVTSGLVLSIALQSFVLVTGLGGQVPLSQAAFVGIGAVIFARGVASWELPFLVGALLAIAVVLIFSLAVSIPATRIRGLPLALLTLAFGLFVDNFVYPAKGFSGSYAGFLLHRPVIFGVDLASPIVWGYAVVFVAFGAAVLVRNLASGETGRVLTAARNSAAAAEAFGADVRLTKLVLFSLASVMAGLSGTLLALHVQSVSVTQFNVAASLQFLTVAIVGGVGNAQGAIVAGLLLYGLPELLGPVGLGDFTQLFFPAVAAVALTAKRGGLADILSRPVVRLWDGLGGTDQRFVAATRSRSGPSAAVPPRPADRHVVRT